MVATPGQWAFNWQCANPATLGRMEHSLHGKAFRVGDTSRMVGGEHGPAHCLAKI